MNSTGERTLKLGTGNLGLSDEYDGEDQSENDLDLDDDSGEDMDDSGSSDGNVGGGNMMYSDEEGVDVELDEKETKPKTED